MIYILLTHDHDYTISQYLDMWGRELRGIVKTRFYEDLPFGRPLKPGTYIFTDLERLSDPQLELARITARQLLRRPGDFHVLNEPTTLLRRYELLKKLHDAGINQFQAHRMNNGALPEQFPLFLRRESEHNGAISSIINSPEELDRAVAVALSTGICRDDLLAVEYCDTSDSAGLFRKYSAFRIGDRIIPRHLLFSKKWVVKLADSVSDENVAEEEQYLQSDPHGEQLKRIFDLANVTYGRIDYALLNGQVQVWEINTNPMISVAPCKIAPRRLYSQAVFAEKLNDAFKAVDHEPTAAPPPLRLRVDPDLSRRLGVRPHQHAVRHLARGIRWLSKRDFVDRYH